MRVAAIACGLAAVWTIAAASALAAQCPDGSPPPCASQRRPDPPLDERTWLVVPFDNVARTAELEWLRDASVNLLYLDLSRWSDIHVVDDERVADLLREVPQARGTRQLSLSLAQAIARRAGAGRLVMGDLLRSGSTTAIVAKLFDTRSGRRLRSVREEVSSPDSILPAFTRLAPAILNVPPPAQKGGPAGAVVTSRVDAYQEYLAGLTALNAVRLVEARRRFERAIQLDTTFALAHYKLAMVLSLESNQTRPRVRELATHASRLAENLPRRERALLESLRMLVAGDNAGACAGYRALVSNDSSDVDALFGLGECLRQDEHVEPASADSAVWRFRGSWSEASRAYVRALATDPSFHVAFQRVLDMHASPIRTGCRRVEPSVPCDESRGSFGLFIGLVRLDADTFAVVPELVGTTGVVNVTRGQISITTRQRQSIADRQRNLEKALGIAEQWVAAAPTESRARAMLGHVYLLLGRLHAAEQQLDIVTGELTADERTLLLSEKFEVKLRLHKTAGLADMLDSVMTLSPDGLTSQHARTIASFLAITGRMRLWDEQRDRENTGPRDASPEVRDLYQRYGRLAPRVALGVMSDSAVEAERQLFEAVRLLPTYTPRMGRATLLNTLVLGLRLPRQTWPAIEVEQQGAAAVPGADAPPAPVGSATTMLFAAAAALARGDTAALRSAVATVDSIPAAHARLEWMASAVDALLILKDTVGALRTARRVLDTTLAATRLQQPIFTPTIVGLLWPRVMLQRAQLAHWLGRREEARFWYSRFLELWSKADAEFQPLVLRARHAEGERATSNESRTVDAPVYSEFQVAKVAAPHPSSPQPRYPETLRDTKVEGEVLVQFVIDTTGRVELSSVSVLKSSHDLFTQAVHDVLPSLRYSPAEIGGRKVRQLAQQPFNFALQR